ncbi:unnamed protein product, partial [Ilex paraguariensis]
AQPLKEKAPQTIRPGCKGTLSRASSARVPLTVPGHPFLAPRHPSSILRELALSFHIADPHF